MNNKNYFSSLFSKLNIILISSAFLLISFYMLFSDRPTVSSTEGRALTKYPEFTLEKYLSGEYTSELQLWFTDTTPDRDDWKKTGVRIKSLFGFSPELSIYGDVSEVSEDKPPIGEVSDPFADYSRDDNSEESVEKSEEPSEDISEVSTEISEESSEIEEPSSEVSSEVSKDDGENEFGIVENLLIYNKRCMEKFGGTYEAGQLYAKYVANYKKDLGKDVNVFSVVVPTASSLYLPENYYKMYGGDQIKKLQYIDDLFEGENGLFKDAGVINVDLYDVLKSHSNEYIYYRSDHHWTMLGSYYAAEQLAKAAGLPFKQLFVSGTTNVNTSNYSYEGKFNDDGSAKPYLGSLYGETQSKILLDNPDVFFWYDYAGDYTCEFYNREDYSKFLFSKDSCYLNINDKLSSQWYMTFLDGDNKAVKITTDVKNGRTAVVFKDSFGNAFVPMMLSSFETIYAVDMRHFTLNSIDFIQKVKATDVVFAVSSFTAFGVNYKYIESMRVVNTQKYIPGDK